jgi:penicillin amidase
MPERARTFAGRRGPVLLERMPSGVMRVTALDRDDALMGLGYAHALDRGLQMLMLRLLGRGQASELIATTDAMLRLDRFFLRANLQRDLWAEESALTDPARDGMAAYCRGVNLCWKSEGLPWELRRHGYPIGRRPWTVGDAFLLAKMTGYLGVTRTQGRLETFLVQCVQRGVTRDRLEELFPGSLEGLDAPLLERVRLEEPVVPEDVPWMGALPLAAASNAWVISGARSASGRPLLANDPHLEINRLPPVWYETVLRWRVSGRYWYAMGGTMPGIPGIALGRTPELAWGVTYGFADTLDSWVEECRNGCYRRGGEWLPFRERRELVRVRNRVALNEPVRLRRRRPVELVFYENDHGVLAGDAHVPGFYLATRWACLEGASASSMDAALALLEARSAAEGRGLVARVNNSSWNWVLADRAGNIALQMSGQVPIRRPGASGLVPLPGWDAANDWQGFATAEQLPRSWNPSGGVLIAANQDVNHLAQVRVINAASADYRATRLQQLLDATARANVADLKRQQFDLVSNQAERFMAHLRPLLAELEAKHPQTARLLLSWDLTYRHDSPGAQLFEDFYHELLVEAFGGSAPGGLGAAVVRHLLHQGTLLPFYYGCFDRVLLADRSAWFHGQTREELYRRALARALAREPKGYGATRTIMLRHLWFGRKLPRWLGFDRGPISLLGGRATVHQTLRFLESGRETAIGPSLRIALDLASDELCSTLPGGARDRRFSRWYANELHAWLQGDYKVLSGLADDTAR